MAKPITIGDMEFKTQKAAVEFFQVLLYKGLFSDADDAALRALVKRHPEYELKAKGREPVSFFVGSNEYGGRCFYLKRPDGTTTDFSFLTCIKGKPSKMAEFKKACRTAVVQDILNEKSLLLAKHGYVCAVTGEALSPEDVHVDHAPPYEFDDIVRLFIAECGVDVESVDIPLGGDNDHVTRFGDEAVADAFRFHHWMCARLRIVSKRVNLSDLRRKTRRAA